MRLRGFVFALALGAFASGAWAAKPFTASDVPPPLKAWVPWAMDRSEHNSCPFLASSSNQHICVWPTSLSLDLGARGGSFSYQLTVYDQPNGKPQRISLPGDDGLWPQGVKINGASAIILANDGAPYVLLDGGEYTVTGNFPWEHIPDSLRLPCTIGLVKATLEQREVANPDIENCTFWIRREQKKEETAQENRVEAKIFRKLTDSIPSQLETSINLNIAGKQREGTLGHILPEGFMATGIQSELSVRLDPDGMLRAQLKPGNYDIRVTARGAHRTASFTLPPQEGILTRQEIWSFEPQDQLRLVQVEGAKAIDPSQTGVPTEWQEFPAYLMQRDIKLELVEKKRGVMESTPDQLTLSRDIWLDFSGEGFTFKDAINGAIHKSSRLEAADGVELGDAAIGGKSQFITTIPKGEKQSNPGVEVREGAIGMTAGSRIESGHATFSATGWKDNFDHVDAHLYLPPGWTLFSYSGVDYVSHSWVGSWTLLDVFFVMLAFVAIAKLFDKGVALLATVALVLIERELADFTLLVLIVLAFMAMLRYLPPGSFRLGVLWLQRVTLLVLFCAALPFMVQHLREAIYPQLKPAAPAGYSVASLNGDGGMVAEKNKGIFHRKKESVALDDKALGQADEGFENTIDVTAMPPMPAMVAPMPAGAGKGGFNGGMLKNLRPMGVLQAAKSTAVNAVPMEQNYQSYAPDTKVQTGFGNSNWYDNAISLRWNGTVDPSVKLSLYLLSAHQNLALAFLRVILMAWLLGLLVEKPLVFWRRGFKLGTVCILFTAAAFSLAPHSSYAQEDRSSSRPLSPDLVYPPQSLLADLKGKLERTLNEPPVCLPDCASVSRLSVSISDDRLTLIEEVHASENVAVPLPGGAHNWRPSLVLADDKPASGLVEGEDGNLYVDLPKGVYSLRMVGPLPAVDSLGISLPLAVHYTTVDAKGWSVEGVHDDGLTDNALQLTRTDKREAGKDEPSLGKSVILPFFALNRALTLGQQWTVETTLRRVTPADSPAAIEVPLLPGETVTTPGITIKNGKAFASFDNQATEVYWQSVIRQQDHLTLTAPSTQPWVETWLLNASNLWHVDTTGIPRGIPRVNSAAMNPAGFWQWRPWPGESLTVQVTRPVGVPGDTRTIDETTLSVVPGQRALDMNLSLKIRSSLGGQHDITLPEGAVLLKVEQDGRALPLELKQNVVTLPLIPGLNRFNIHWKHDAALPEWFKVPPVDLGVKHSVNATVSVDLPQDRWVLYAHGPQVGPALLLWSGIPVILILAIGLGRLGLTPLGAGAWFLLMLGLSQASLAADFIVVAWLLALSARERLSQRDIKWFQFNFAQVVLVCLSIISISLLFDSIRLGLLGAPDMHIAGGGSYGTHLQWYQDITMSRLPHVVVLSVPNWIYRLLMLAWSLWLAFALVGWLRLGWRNFTAGGYWRKG